ncbi:MAG: tetratricopeptide repeat protein [Planctomycetota bacterium]
MITYITKKLKKRQNFKLCASAIYLCLIIFNNDTASQCLANTQADYLDPIEILISSAQENHNEPNNHQPDMKITDIQLEVKQTQDVFPLDFTTSLDQELMQDSHAVSLKHTSEPAEELLQASISILSNDDNSKIKDELQNLIEQINSIKLQPDNINSQPDASNQTETTIESPIEPIIKQEQAEKDMAAGNEKELPYIPIGEQTIHTIDKLAEKSQEVDNPFELAELLFLSNHLKKAAVFYEQALSQTSTDSSISVQRKAWILFQIGNCLRHDDPDRAKQMYTQLINEFPESSWSELAKSRVGLIDWFQTDKPEEIITENQS